MVIEPNTNTAPAVTFVRKIGADDRIVALVTIDELTIARLLAACETIPNGGDERVPLWQFLNALRGAVAAAEELRR